MTRFIFLATSAFALMIMACAKHENSNQAASAPGGSNQTVATQPVRAPSTPSERLLAAAEPFELLTETAFTDPPAKLDQTIAEGRRALANVQSLLSPGAATRAEELLAQIGRDRKADNRSDLALSSIEIYRSLVSAVPAGTKVPTDVSLLDYAGFRYQADLKATPVRWNDMKQALAFARSHWAAIAPKITDKNISGPFEAALANMTKAVASRDTTLAASSVTDELNQVDKLEAYFNSN